MPTDSLERAHGALQLASAASSTSIIRLSKEKIHSKKTP
jgi:hypothetical protein